MDKILSVASAGTITIGEFNVYRMGYGAMRLTGQGIWGPPSDTTAAQEVLRKAVEYGINFIDTADAYGPEVSETMIADTLHPYEGIVVATKGGLIRPGPDDWQPDCNPAHLRKACDASLERLKVDSIDIYQLHTVDPKVPFKDSLQTLIDLKNEGKIKHIGLSNIEPEHLREALQMTQIASVQNNYNLANREHDDVLMRCEQHGVVFIPYFPLGSGDLTKPDGPLADMAKKYDATTGQVALAWLLAHSPVMLPIPGTSSLEHLAENVGACNIQFDASDKAELDKMY